MRSVQDWIDAYLPLITDRSQCTDAEISAFEKKWPVVIRNDHRRFLSLFGGDTGATRVDFLHITNSSYSVEALEDYYTECANFPDMYPPDGWTLFAVSDLGRSVAVNKLRGSLFEFEDNRLFDLFSDSIDKFLAQRLFSYINFYSTRDKNRQLGFYGLRKLTSNDELISFLESNDFDVIQELCDNRQIFAQRGDVYFLSDFGPPHSQPTNPNHYGDFRFATPAKDERVIWSLSKDLAAVLGVAHRIQS